MIKGDFAADTSGDDYDDDEDNHGNDGDGSGGGRRPKEKEKKSGKSSRYKGVYLDRRAARVNRPRPWRASIRINRTTVELGHFSSEESAARAYDRYARQHGPPDMFLNFPNDKPSSKKMSSEILL